MTEPPPKGTAAMRLLTLAPTPTHQLSALGACQPDQPPLRPIAVNSALKAPAAARMAAAAPGTGTQRARQRGRVGLLRAGPTGSEARAPTSAHSQELVAYAKTAQETPAAHEALYRPTHLAAGSGPAKGGAVSEDEQATSRLRREEAVRRLMDAEDAAIRPPPVPAG